MSHEFHFFEESGKYKTFGLKVVFLVMFPIDSFTNRILLKATIFFSNLIVNNIPILFYIILKRTYMYNGLLQIYALFMHIV
jgi:hypothetical protein